MQNTKSGGNIPSLTVCNPQVTGCFFTSSLRRNRTVPLTATHYRSFVSYSRTQDRDEEVDHQLAIVNANATKGLLGMIKKGDEEWKW